MELNPPTSVLRLIHKPCIEASRIGAYTVVHAQASDGIAVSLHPRRIRHAERNIGERFCPSISSGSVARQVDHIMINSDEPEELFRFLSERLGFPTAWAFQSYGTFSSGGLGFGDVNIEVIHIAGQQAGIVGVALEPGSVSELVSGLDDRGLKHRAPARFYRKDSSGKDLLMWTTVTMLDLPPAPESTVFFCKYNTDVGVRRARIQGELQSHGGGPLGFESMVELVIGVRDLAAAQHDWRLLLGPERAGQEGWQLASGPSIRLVAAQENRLALLPAILPIWLALR